MGLESLGWMGKWVQAGYPGVKKEAIADPVH
jgi:hypothetical protein